MKVEVTEGYWSVPIIVNVTVAIVCTVLEEWLGIYCPLIPIIIIGWTLFGIGILAVQFVRYAFIPATERKHRLALFETNLGREAGWYVEHHGQKVAILSEPRFEDMFWDSYKIEPVLADEQERQQLLSNTEMWLRGEFVFRNRRFDVVVPDAFPSGNPFLEEGRVCVRGLYLWCSMPIVPERIVLWWRRFWNSLIRSVGRMR